MRKNLSHIAIGAGGGVLFCTFIAVAYIVWRAALLPVPYKDVFIREQWREGAWLHLTATFIKTECEFRKLSAIGHDFGETVSLPWIDRETPGGDRLLGVQTLRINIGRVSQVDRIELRTRHDCGGDIVDRTFAWLDPDETIRPDKPRAAMGGHINPVQQILK